MTSKIKVDNISDQDDNNIINESGDVITVGAAGDTVAVAGNIVKSNAYQASDGGNIASQSGTTITLGASGDTVTLASGASQSGFGRTGTVDWQTGSIKTATFTAANGEGYFANTSGGAFTMNLPAGTAGNIVSVVDYTNTFQTNGLTISPNGSQKIGGVNADITLTTEGQSVTFVYVDDTEGWKNVQDSTSNIVGNPNLVASGGTITTCGNFKIHTFTGPGTFTVCKISSTAADNTVSYTVVAGGGAGGNSQNGPARNGGGGGGAGGYREFKSPVDSYTASPKNGNPGGTSVTVTAQAYPITVGGGGTGGAGEVGNNSVFSTVTSAGGGGGGANEGQDGDDGGSGGGAGASGNAGSNNGGGNTPPVSPPQGNSGGTSHPSGGGGGGGATATGSNGPGGNGGAGTTSSIPGSSTPYAGGGGGGTTGPGGGGGNGGGGAGSPGGSCSTGQNGDANKGGGGGGAGGGAGNAGGGNGGSGVVIIRYKYQ
jgi:hypothetical protein